MRRDEERTRSTSGTATISRRGLLAGAAGAGALAMAGCADDAFDGMGIHAARVSQVRADDPDDPSWTAGPVRRVDLGPQDMALPNKLSPSITWVDVRAVHDGTNLGFLLTWDDPDASDLTIAVEQFRDACAVLLAPGVDQSTLRAMGSGTTPATLLQWKADWQRDNDKGLQDLGDEYPNRSIDVYPPLWDVAPLDVSVQSYIDHDAVAWLPGINAGNPVSPSAPKGPVEKLIAYGFGTSKTSATQNATGRGVRTSTGWKVAVSRPMAATDDGELSVSPASTFTTAFAVWSGGVRDAGSRKQPSIEVHTVSLAP